MSFDLGRYIIADKMLLFFGGIDMAYKKQKNVNIDALIAREDFEAADETTNTASKISTLSVNDFK